MSSTNIPRWSERTKFEKGLFIIQVILIMIVLVFTGLQIVGVYDNVLRIVYPIMAIVMFLFFVQYRKYNKRAAYLYLVTSILGVVCSLRIFLA